MTSNFTTDTIDSVIEELSNTMNEDNFFNEYCGEEDMFDFNDAHFTMKLSQYGKYIGEGTPNILSKVEVKESPISNNGVFATKLIRSGELITLYPIHWLQYNKEEYIYSKSHFDKEIEKKDIENYSFEINDNKTIIASHKIYDDPTFLGHKINDAATNFTSRDLYLSSGHERENAEFYEYEFCVFIRAIKDIQIGEEILVMYGESYWFNKSEVYLRWVDDIDSIMRRLQIHKSEYKQYKVVEMFQCGVIGRCIFRKTSLSKGINNFAYISDVDENIPCYQLISHWNRNTVKNSVINVILKEISKHMRIFVYTDKRNIPLESALKWILISF